MSRIALGVLFATVLIACGTEAESREDLESQAEIPAAAAQPAAAEGMDADRLSARASVATLKHQAVLADVYERVPETAVTRTTRTGTPFRSCERTAGRA